MKIDANRLIVNINTIINNINILKKHSKAKFYAVVKANAYGLGAVEISKNIENIVDLFCVANINEALELRKNGIKKDILILGYISKENYELLSDNDIIATIYDYNIAKEINNIGKNIRVHIKIETGHNRLGFTDTEKHIEEIRKINEMEYIKIEGIYTHLSSADMLGKEDILFTNHQEKIFSNVINELSDISKNWIKHISNDAAIIAYDFDYDAVRSGISMYGVYPSLEIKKNYNIGIEEAFTLLSKISFIKEIKKGESVSYGRKFKASKDMKIATVSIGYADGYHRQISNKGYVLVNGKKANILGNITMDQMMIAVDDIECNIGDDVVLIGKSKNEIISIEYIAEWAGTISYEMMTSISGRVYREYLKE